MIVRVGDRIRCGPVVDLRDARTEVADRGRALVAAIRGAESPFGVVCPPPGPVHERVGHVRPEMGVSVRTALAAAGRSRGLDAPVDERLAAVRERLASLESTESGTADGGGDRVQDETRVRTEPADAPEGTDLERLRERVAELRGRVQTLEDGEDDAAEARERLRETAGQLAEAETRRIAAVERRERRRERRDRRERRLTLQDRLANLERSARSHLVDRLRDEFADAVADVPEGTGTDEDAVTASTDDPFAADPVTAALAVCRVASVSAPIVLAVDRFADPAAAARWLEAPVVAV